MKGFRSKKYEIFSHKVKQELRFAFLSDLHGLSFGEKNELLIKEIRAFSPDAVLLAGDMIVRGKEETLRTAKDLLTELAKEFPVYYSLGNHECRIFESDSYRSMQEPYRAYENSLEKAGVHILHNERDGFTKGDETVGIWGLEIPMEYYKKPRSPRFSLEEMIHLLGRREDGFSILLAHNPKYGKTYFDWGGDLILSGHYHGGVLRLGENRGLTSPQYLVLPPFCCGKFTRGEQNMIVSAGLGEHTIPVRIHNPRELLLITVKPLEKSGISM